jgi:hypothetical protein
LPSSSPGLRLLLLLLLLLLRLRLLLRLLLLRPPLLLLLLLLCLILYFRSPIATCKSAPFPPLRPRGYAFGGSWVVVRG